MNKGYFFKKRLLQILGLVYKGFVKAVSRIFKLIFAKRTIVFVTNEKIKSINVGPIPQACVILFLAWVGNLFIQSIYFDKIIRMKSDEIAKLKSVNGYFGDEFSDVNEKLKKINEYLISVIGYDQESNKGKTNYKNPKTFKKEELSKKDKNTLNEIKDIEQRIADISIIAESRIGEIEGIVSLTGLNIKKIPQKKQNKIISDLEERLKNRGLDVADIDAKNYFQGGPIQEDESLNKIIAGAALTYKDLLDKNMASIRFSNKFDYLMVLEKLVGSMPLSKPMVNYFTSSGFGTRRDPLTKKVVRHRGLDFVGSSKAKVISPSKGRVILAGRYGDYGNAIVIDHGFGITTRYGHLSKIDVKPGQEISKGQVIGRQGSTGRSTGPHLHYEVRYKNTALNPKKFLDAGEEYFKEKTEKNVTS